MAKSIRSKAKRKLRAAKREKIVAKERLKLLAKQEEEEGIKMIQDAVESSDISDNTPAALSGNVDESMYIVPESQSVVKAKKKRGKKTSGLGKNVKRLKKKRKNKYKW